MDEVASARRRADPNVVNGLISLASSNPAFASILLLPIKRLRNFLPVAMRHVHFVYLFSLVVPTLGHDRHFRPQIKRLKLGRFGHEARMIGCIHSK